MSENNGSETTGLISFRPWHIMLLACLGIAFGTVVILFHGSHTTKSQLFTQTPYFLVWAFMTSLQVGMIFVLFGYLYNILKKLRKYTKDNRTEVIFSALLLLGLFALPFLIQYIYCTDIISHPLYLFEEKVTVLILLGFFAVVFPVLIGILRIIWIVQEKFINVDAEADIKLYLLMQERLQSFVTLMGILVGILSLIIGAYRLALMKADFDLESFPAVYVIVCGAYYALLIALIYVPTHQRLLKAGRRILDTICPLPPENAKSWPQINKDHQTLKEVLQLQTGTLQKLKSGLSIAAPLLSSAVSLLTDYV